MDKNTKQVAAIPFTPYQKFVVAILALLQFTVILDFMVISPLGDILIKTLNVSPSQFGLVVSSYAFSAGASGILAAGFADKFDRKKLLVFFYVGFIIGTLLCGLSVSYEMLVAARIVTGLFGGVIGSISLAIVTDLFEIHHRGRVMGIIQMAFAGSQVLGIPIGIFIANHWGWHATFLMIVGLATVIFIVMLMKLQPVAEHLKMRSDKSPFLHLWHTITNSRYRVGFMATAFLAIGGFMLMPFSTAFLVNNIRISEKQLPLIFMLTGLSSIIIMPVIGKLSDKYDKFKLFTIGSLLAIAMVTIYTNLSEVPLWEVIIINMFLFMGIMSRVIPATALNTAIPKMQDRGAFMSLTASLQQIAGGLAAICAGFIVKQASKTSPLENYNVLGYVVSTVVVICIFLIYRVSVLVKKDENEVKPVSPAPKEKAI
jgi:predicted MFS family arabinose efflux permease